MALYRGIIILLMLTLNSKILAKSSEDFFIIKAKCEYISSESDADKCLKYINQVNKNIPYKDKLLQLKEKALRIKRAIILLKKIESINCSSIEDKWDSRWGEYKNCVEKKRKLLNEWDKEFSDLKKINSIKMSYFAINSIIKGEEESIIEVEKQKKVETKNIFTFVSYIIISLVAGVISLFVAKKLGVDLNETIILEERKKDRRYKIGYRVIGRTKTTRGKEIFVNTVIITFIAILIFSFIF